VGDGVNLDVMPTDAKILGFGNCWYKEAVKYSTSYNLTDKISIKILTPPYFLATKLEAFQSRGKMDFYASHDFEDIVSVIDGRSTIVNEIKSADKKVKSHLIEKFSDINKNPAFRGALPGHFNQYPNLAEDRIELFEEKIKNIIGE
jgi:hypothetical protein